MHTEGKPAFKLAHIGINAENPEESLAVARAFAALFDLGVKEGNSSNFAGTEVEVMKRPYHGRLGHIAFATPDVEEAVGYCESRGFAFDASTAKYKDGVLNAIYFREEIGGFAIHLLRQKP